MFDHEVVVVAFCNKCNIVYLTRRVMSYHLRLEHGFVIERERQAAAGIKFYSQCDGCDLHINEDVK